VDRVEELLHKLDKEQVKLKATTTAILADHTGEINILRKDFKALTALVNEKFGSIWLKITGLTTGIVALAILLGQFFL
jgi:ribosomal protein L29